MDRSVVAEEARRGSLKLMNAQSPEPVPEIVRWLSTHAGFPSRRLDAKAVVQLCVAQLAADEEREEQARFLIERKDVGQQAALRAHGLRRAQVHFKCDNSAKV